MADEDLITTYLTDEKLKELQILLEPYLLKLAQRKIAPGSDKHPASVNKAMENVCKVILTHLIRDIEPVLNERLIHQAIKRESSSKEVLTRLNVLDLSISELVVIVDQLSNLSMPDRKMDYSIHKIVNPIDWELRATEANRLIERSQKGATDEKDDICWRHAFMGCPFYTSSMFDAYSSIPPYMGISIGRNMQEKRFAHIMDSSTSRSVIGTGCTETIALMTAYMKILLISKQEERIRLTSQ